VSGGGVDLEAARKLCEQFLRSLGVGETDREMEKTPRRVAELYARLLGADAGPAPSMSALPNPNADRSPVYVRGISFHSMCAHHLVPFFGHVDIAYVPGDHVGGVGAFANAVRYFARRPQLQERMVREIADHLQAQIAPRGVFVRATPRQLCMEMQHERADGELGCSSADGCLAVGGALRVEVLNALGDAGLSDSLTCG
jgi:GTP cyclohydrolase IA